MSARSQRRVLCTLCDPWKQVTLNNFNTHVGYHHHEHVGEDRRTLYVELDGSPPAKPGAPVPPASLEGGLPRGRRPRREVELAATPTKKAAPAPPPLGLEDVDAIVLAVVDQLAEPAGLLPVAHLPALFAWREATATFLRAVRVSPGR